MEKRGSYTKAKTQKEAAMKKVMIMVLGAPDRFWRELTRLRRRTTIMFTRCTIAPSIPGRRSKRELLTATRAW